MPTTAAATSTAITGENVTVRVDTRALAAESGVAYDCAATEARFFADLTAQNLPADCVMNLNMQAGAKARLFLKIHQSTGSLRVRLVLAEGSEAEVFAHVSLSDVQLVFAAEIQRNATARFFGLTQTAENQHTDIVVDVRHVQGENLSEQKFYSFASGHSTIGFTGKISVDSGSGGAVAHQLHRGTALADTARIDAKPFLNIKHDDVRCTHGSTVGFIDAAARHYLMARGMTQNDAEAMLIRSSEQQFYGAVPEGEAQNFFTGGNTEL